MRNCRRLILIATLCLASTPFVSCGKAPDLPYSSQVSVSIAPATATIRVSESVDLQGTVTGLSSPTLDWWMQEQHDNTDINGSADCDHVTTQTQTASCRYGYLTGSGMVTAPSAAATYHAPETPGTYHVTLRAFQMSLQVIGEAVEKRTTATITVTP